LNYGIPAAAFVNMGSKTRPFKKLSGFFVSIH
jgi:hypothetical protein